MNTKIRQKLLTFLIGMLVLSLCFLAGTTALATDGVATPNDVNACNQEVTQTSAVTISYNGAYTGRYGIQAYAGLPAGGGWILGAATPYADYGVGSHGIGSNAQDGRSNLAMTLSINSSVAGDAYIYLNLECGVVNEPLSVKVNDAEPFTYNLAGAGYTTTVNGIYGFRPEIIKVSLVEGVNTITLTTGENYTGWYFAFAISPKADYKVVDYDGTATGIYSMQGYANFSGPAWPIADASNLVDYGKGAGPIGSNAGDKRSNLQMTLNVNSTVSGNAFLYLYVQQTTKTESLSIKVNDGDAFSWSFGNNDSVGVGNYRRPQAAAVTLKEGSNTIVLTTGANYQGWYHGFAIAPTAPDYAWVAPSQNATSAKYSPATWVEIGGYFDSGNSGAIGNNAQDSSADYGKTGYAVYEISVENAGSYTFGMNVMSGSPLSNKVKFTLNDTVLQFDGKEYYAFDTSAGWSYAYNYIQLDLIKGKNTLKIESYLTWCVGGAEVAAGTEGAYGMVNWWINEFSLTKNSNVQLELDTSNVQKTYNPGWKPETVEGLKVYLVVDGVKQETPLNESDYEASINGDVVTVSYKGSAYTNVQSANYSLSQVSDGIAREGKTVTLTNEGTGNLSLYNYAAIKGEGTGVCEGRLFWVVTETHTEDGGYLFGSQGSGTSENRQMTLTLKIDNKGTAGKYLFKVRVYGVEYAKDFVSLTVNDGDAKQINLFAWRESNEYYPCIYEVDLVSGENTVILKTCEQYSIWFYTFEICPISYTDKEEYDIEDAAREGVSGFDTVNKLILATSENHSLTYFVNVDKAGKFELNFFVGKTAGKTFKVSIDGNDAIVLNTLGGDSVSTVADLTQGNHTVKVIFDAGEDSKIDFVKMTKTLCKAVTTLRVDTSEMNLEVEKGTAFNVAKLKVYVTYEGESEETLITNGYTVDSSAYDANTAGSYDIVVSYIAYPEVNATFKMVVKAEKVVNGIEVDASKVANLANGEELDMTKLVVKICYSDGSKLPAMSNDYVVTAVGDFSCKVAGEYTFTVTYAQNSAVSTTFKVTVAEVEKGESKGGCGSFVGATSVVLGALVISGASLILAKKKED